MHRHASRPRQETGEVGAVVERKNCFGFDSTDPRRGRAGGAGAVEAAPVPASSCSPITTLFAMPRTFDRWPDSGSTDSPGTSNIEVESNPCLSIKLQGYYFRWAYLKARRTQQLGSVFSILQQGRSVDQRFRRVPRQIACGVFRIEPQQMLKYAQKWYLLGGVCDLR